MRYCSYILGISFVQEMTGFPVNVQLNPMVIHQYKLKFVDQSHRLTQFYGSEIRKNSSFSKRKISSATHPDYTKPYRITKNDEKFRNHNNNLGSDVDVSLKIRV